MLTFSSNKGGRLCDGVSRRDFLRVGGLTAGSVGLSLSQVCGLQARNQVGDMNCIILFLVGGPSQLETWDPKPAAPDNVRGPFKAIATNVPGIHLSEHFPRMAQVADRFAIVRSVHHRAAPIHETGHQLMQTGYLFRNDREYPHYGAVLSHLRGGRQGLPPFVVLPGPIGNTGVSVHHGQGAGYLGAGHEPFCLRGQPGANGFGVTNIGLPGLDPARLPNRHELISAIDDAQRAYDAVGGRAGSNDPAYNLLFAHNTRRALDLGAESTQLRARYGSGTFGQSCLLARRLIEQGVRLVTVNMFETVFNQATWDCHADGGALGSNLDDYRDTLCPTFDLAYTALLEDLQERGLLANTLVVAMGEFGRTPQLNPRGGRDHWPGVWSILLAGGGVRGGQVVGSSDRTGSEPRDRPVSPAEVAATIYHALGIAKDTRLPGPDNSSLPVYEAEPVLELFR